MEADVDNSQVTGPVRSFPIVNDEVAEGTPRWLLFDEGPVYTVLHTPEPDVARKSTSVLLVPPLGLDEFCSHRARRVWATQLAEAGFPAARIDLPASEDSSGSPTDPDLVARWQRTVEGTVAWLRASTSAERIAVIGIGVGGMLAVRALAAGAEIDDLILWAVPAKGRNAMREMAMMAQGIAVSSGEVNDERPETETREAFAGFIVSSETQSALRELDLSKLELPDLTRSRVLMLKRDALNVDEGLRKTLTDAGATVEVAEGEYRTLMSPPLNFGTPYTTIRTSLDWLAREAAPGLNEPPVPPSPSSLVVVGEASPTAEMPWSDGTVTETLISYRSALFPGRMQGILTDAGPTSSDICAVLIHPTRRTGPNRLWVQLARRWAMQGITCVRIDTEATGDSDGDGDKFDTESNRYAPIRIELIKELFDQLAASGVGSRFVTVGQCATAYATLNAAIGDPRVQQAIGLNLWAFEWTARLYAERKRARTASLARGGAVKRVATGLREGWISSRDVREILSAQRFSGRFGRSEEVSQSKLIRERLDALRDQGTRVTLLFSKGQPFPKQMALTGIENELARWPNLKVEPLPTHDHNVRAPWVQDTVVAAIDETLQTFLATA